MGYSRSTTVAFGLWVGLFVALCSAAVNIRTISNDNIPNVLIPVSVLREGNLDLNEFRYLIDDSDQRVCYWAVETPQGRFSRYPIWTGIVASPFFMPVALFGSEQIAESLLLRVGRFAAVAACGLFAGFMAVALRRYVPGLWAATLTLFAVTGSTVQHQLGANLSNQTLPILCVGAVIWLLTTSNMTRARALCAGLIAGLAVASRLPMVFIALAPLGMFLSHEKWRRHLPFVAMGLPIFPGATLLYQAVAFGDPLQTGYGDEPGTGFTAPLAEGLAGLLVSPTCGLLVYSPWLIFGLVGGMRCWLGRGINPDGNAMGRWLALGVVGQLLVFSKWWAWNGALSFGGPRMLAETIPALTMLIALGGVLRKGQSDPHKRANGVAIALAVLGSASILHFLIGTAVYDAVAPDNPEKPDWNLSADFIALYVSKHGIGSLAGAAARHVGMFALTIGLMGYMTLRMLRPSTPK